MEIAYSINQYDKDGDKHDDCVIIHINDTFLLRLSDVSELELFIKKLQNIKNEINETYDFDNRKFDIENKF